MDDLMLRRRVLLGLLNEEYIIFADPVVEQICATNWGDGVGLKPSQAARVTNSQFSGKFRENSTITSFDEYEYFTGLTTANRSEFQNDTSLVSVNIPSTLTTISALMFSGCSSLESLGTAWMDSVMYIGGSAFYNCTNLVIDDLALPNLKKLSLSAAANPEASQFAYCAKLKKVSNLGSITRMSGTTFRYCSALEEITFPSTLQSIEGTSVFQGVTALKKVHVSSVDHWLSVTLNANSCAPYYASTQTGRGLWVNNVLQTTITIPSTITSIGQFLFYNMDAIQSISIPSTVTSISAEAFYKCTGLTGNLDLRGISLGQGAFRYCTELTNVTMSGFDLGSTGIKYFPFSDAGNGTGTLNVKGSINVGYQSISSQKLGYFKHVIIEGDLTYNSGYEMNNGIYETFIIQGNVTNNNNGTVGLYYDRNSTKSLKFMEIYGTYNNKLIQQANSPAVNMIMHLKYNGIAGAADKSGASFANVTKIYVGDGSSQAADQTVLNQYLADTGWAAYSSKLDLWYNYSGEYKN